MIKNIPSSHSSEYKTWRKTVSVDQIEELIAPNRRIALLLLRNIVLSLYGQDIFSFTDQEIIEYVVFALKKKQLVFDEELLAQLLHGVKRDRGLQKEGVIPYKEKKPHNKKFSLQIKSRDGYPVPNVIFNLNFPPEEAITVRTNDDGKVNVYDSSKTLVHIDSQDNFRTFINTLDVQEQSKPLTASSTPGIWSCLGPYTLAKVTTHRIKPGETLQGIARKYGITWEDLAKFNFGTVDKAEVDHHQVRYLGGVFSEQLAKVVFNGYSKGILYICMPWICAPLRLDQEYSFYASPLVEQQALNHKTQIFFPVLQVPVMGNQGNFLHQETSFEPLKKGYFYFFIDGKLYSQYRLTEPGMLEKIELEEINSAEDDSTTPELNPYFEIPRMEESNPQHVFECAFSQISLHRNTIDNLEKNPAYRLSRLQKLVDNFASDEPKEFHHNILPFKNHVDYIALRHLEKYQHIKGKLLVIDDRLTSLRVCSSSLRQFWLERYSLLTLRKSLGNREKIKDTKDLEQILLKNLAHYFYFGRVFAGQDFVLPSDDGVALQKMEKNTHIHTAESHCIDEQVLNAKEFYCNVAIRNLENKLSEELFTTREDHLYYLISEFYKKDDKTAILEVFFDIFSMLGIHPELLNMASCRNGELNYLKYLNYSDAMVFIRRFILQKAPEKLSNLDDFLKDRYRSWQYILVPLSASGEKNIQRAENGPNHQKLENQRELLYKKLMIIFQIATLQLSATNNKSCIDEDSLWQEIAQLHQKARQFDAYLSLLQENKQKKDDELKKAVDRIRSAKEALSAFNIKYQLLFKNMNKAEQELKEVESKNIFDMRQKERLLKVKTAHLEEMRGNLLPLEEEKRRLETENTLSQRILAIVKEQSIKIDANLGSKMNALKLLKQTIAKKETIFNDLGDIWISEYRVLERKLSDIQKRKKDAKINFVKQEGIINHYRGTLEQYKKLYAGVVATDGSNGDLSLKMREALHLYNLFKFQTQGLQAYEELLKNGIQVIKGKIKNVDALKLKANQETAQISVKLGHHQDLPPIFWASEMLLHNGIPAIPLNLSLLPIMLGLLPHGVLFLHKENMEKIGCFKQDKNKLLDSEQELLKLTEIGLSNLHHTQMAIITQKIEDFDFEKYTYFSDVMVLNLLDKKTQVLLMIEPLLHQPYESTTKIKEQAIQFRDIYEIMDKLVFLKVKEALLSNYIKGFENTQEFTAEAEMVRFNFESSQTRIPISNAKIELAEIRFDMKKVEHEIKERILDKVFFVDWERHQNIIVDTLIDFLIRLKEQRLKLLKEIKYNKDKREQVKLKAGNLLSNKEEFDRMLTSLEAEIRGSQILSKTAAIVS